MDLFHSLSPIGQTIFGITMVAATGLLLGLIRIRGIGLGSAGTLFSGLALAACGFPIQHEVLDFAKEFGLILFVFAIGIQLGPSVIGLWKEHGVRLNSVSVGIVTAGMLLTLLFAVSLNIPGESSAGLFSGATTNTPSLGAAQQALTMTGQGDPSALQDLTSAYAIAYPGAILGIICSMLMLKSWMKIDLDAEREAFRKSQPVSDPLVRRNIAVENPNLEGVAIKDVPGMQETGVKISRHHGLQSDETTPATPETTLHVGDVILCVGPEEALDRFQLVIGSSSDHDLMEEQGDIQFQRIVVTNRSILGKSLQELALDHLWGVSVTRLIRSGVEMTASGRTRLHFGDLLHIVGRKEGLKNVSSELGNAAQELNQTQFVPFFLGIGLGIMAGMIPFSIPGFSVPVRLGLAGGPLVVAIIFGMIGNIGRLAWYIPANANKAFRELGMILFLSAVGLHAGGKFFSILFSSQGATFFLCGAVITVIPLLLIGWLARKFLRLNFITLSGVIAGSMTDPPALAFASTLCKSEGSAVAYAAVYPLSMTLRIIAAQALVAILCSPG